MNRFDKRRQQKRAQKQGRSHTQNDQLQNVLNLAVQHHQQGRLAEAKNLYQQVLQAQPNHPAALHLLGVVALQAGKCDTAHDLISKAIQIAPDVADMHYNLGNADKELGRFGDAAERYRRAITLTPDYGQAYFNLGQVLHQLGQLQDAEAAFATLLTIAPNSAQAHFEMGNVLQAQNRFDDAARSYQTAIDLEPGVFQIHANLGLVLHKLGRLDDALSRYQTALSIAPDQAMVHNNFANVLFDQGALQEAASAYRQALALQPDFAQTHFNLARTLDALGDANGFVHFRQATALDAERDEYWLALEDMVTRMEFSHGNDELLDTLRELLRRTTTRPQKFARAAVSALKCHPKFTTTVRNILSADEIDVEQVATQFSKFPLFIDILGLSPLNDLELEQVLVRVRKAFLKAVLNDGVRERNLEFYCALAHQLFANEYVLAVDEDEVEHLRQLEEKHANIDPQALVAVATYKPLHTCSWSENLGDTTWPPAVMLVITRQVTEPLQERAIGQDINTLATIDDQCSQDVRQQYEENPYPRWIRTGRPAHAVGFVASLEHLPMWRKPDDFAPGAPAQILIAGCGTGQQALDVAAHHADAQVLAVDLSLTSLSYAQRKTQELGIDNIDYVQGDILKLDALDKTFDLIESVGVLHHMAAPETGWRILVDLLRPNGFMKIGLYSELARQPVIKARELIAKHGFAATPDGIRDARAEIVRRIEGGDDVLKQLLDTTDFYTLSECRDLVFHVQEHRFSLPDIENILQKLDLKFLGFELSQPSIKTRFEHEHAQPSDLYDLAQWHDFEVKHPDTFKGMYQFWCQKKS